MKTRTGFVSNSSSSSFIIHKPSENKIDVEYVKDFLYKEGYSSEYYDEGEFERTVNSLLEEFGETGEFIHANIEYGGEESTLYILDKLNVKYVDLEDI